MGPQFDLLSWAHNLISSLVRTDRAAGYHELFSTSEHSIYNICLTLCTDTNKTVPLQVMKTFRGLHPFVTSILGGGEQSASRPGRRTIAERASITHQTGGWVGPTAIWTFRRQNIVLYLPKIERSQNNDFIIPVTWILCLFLISSSPVSEHRTITGRN